MSLKEQVTPHKIAVLVLIKQYCLVRHRMRRQSAASIDHVISGPITVDKCLVTDSLLPVTVEKCEPPTRLVELNQSGDTSLLETNEKEIKLTEAEMKTFMLSILDLIQSCDLEPENLMGKMKTFCNEDVYQLVVSDLEEMKTGIQCVMSFFQTLSQTLFAEHNPMVHRASVIGLFVRRMILCFEVLSFSHVTKLYKSFQRYFKNSPLKQNTERRDQTQTDSMVMDESCSMDITGDVTTDDVTLPDPDQGAVKPVPLAKHGNYSQRQAEFFILQQSNLLQYNEEKALPPAQLQQNLSQLLTANPQLSDAHYLSYLNHLRVDEYCGAVHSLYHYFDRSQFQPAKTDKDEDIPQAKSYRYAILNLAALHFRFGHREEALTALKEAMSVAQEYNDNVCLQHALAWYHRLGEGDVPKSGLVEKSNPNTTDIHLSYLTSLSVQVLAKRIAFEGITPASVFDHIMRSDVLNCQHCLSDLSAVSCAQKSAIWTMYGNTLLSTLYSQALLNLTRYEHGVQINGEANCIAQCTLARSFADQGLFNQSFTILGSCRSQFPQHCQYSAIWRLTEQIIHYDQNMHKGNFSALDEIITCISSIDSIEGRLRRALYLKEIGDTDSAQKLLNDLKNDKNLNEHPAMFCRVTMAYTELCCQIGNAVGAIDSLLACIVMCKRKHLLYHQALASVYVAYVQFCLNLPQQAVNLIEENLVTILNLGNRYDKSRCLYLYAKCRVAASREVEQRRSVLFSVTDLLSRVVDGFNAVGNERRIKDVYYYQARLHHELGCISERNKFAIEFRKLDQICPTLNQMTVNTL